MSADQRNPSNGHESSGETRDRHEQPETIHPAIEIPEHVKKEARRRQGAYRRAHPDKKPPAVIDYVIDMFTWEWKADA